MCLSSVCFLVTLLHLRSSRLINVLSLLFLSSPSGSNVIVSHTCKNLAKVLFLMFASRCLFIQSSSQIDIYIIQTYTHIHIHQNTEDIAERAVQRLLRSLNVFSFFFPPDFWLFLSLPPPYLCHYLCSPGSQFCEPPCCHSLLANFQPCIFVNLWLELFLY